METFPSLALAEDKVASYDLFNMEEEEFDTTIPVEKAGEPATPTSKPSDNSDKLIDGIEQLTTGTV